ncbi:30S ribosome-binding factor RbfA [Buchnera aphidicola]|uniref:Ribosome-binding factor A n=1 Tax=Buchnera aphidicola subsp. Baizongia pistaciae (strain Bp) TaxID=224915 RepID=RBFA_BUCBP|nr:30S ribosome-binding factor RbfA [Buchnera aphidicola]P59411.1 RecName: Full=Ribosome-binding factor A [Buchnera aphidicola str. Bp (Baizongia pistaciae)]
MQKLNRSFKISNEIKKKISWIICYQLCDPRLFNILISVSSVNLSRDFSYAKIYVSILNNKNISFKEILTILQNSSKHIRYLLAKGIFLRIIPTLHFCHDSSYVNGTKITNLINNVLYNK